MLQIIIVTFQSKLGMKRGFFLISELLNSLGEGFFYSDFVRSEQILRKMYLS